MQGKTKLCQHDRFGDSLLFFFFGGLGGGWEVEWLVLPVCVLRPLVRPFGASFIPAIAPGSTATTAAVTGSRAFRCRDVGVVWLVVQAQMRWYGVRLCGVESRSCAGGDGGVVV